MKEIDVRGRPCPQPVLMVLEAIKQGETAFRVLLDNAEAVQNVLRAVQSQGYRGQTTRQGDRWQITVTSGTPGAEEPVSTPPEKPVAEAPSCGRPSVATRTLVIQSESLGHGSVELGKRILAQLLNTLALSERRPQYIVLVNTGAKLAAEGSDLVEPLRDLEQKGVLVLVCGTCINYFGLEGKLAVGRPTNTYEVLNLMLDGGVITWG